MGAGGEQVGRKQVCAPDRNGFSAPERILNNYNSNGLASRHSRSFRQPWRTRITPKDAVPNIARYKIGEPNWCSTADNSKNRESATAMPPNMPFHPWDLAPLTIHARYLAHISFRSSGLAESRRAANALKSTTFFRIAVALTLDKHPTKLGRKI